MVLRRVVMEVMVISPAPAYTGRRRDASEVMLGESRHGVV
jgi:hypothetical protein